MEQHRTKTDMVIALIGNPNSGKTSIFNKLTGAHQKVGNWPGVTVEKKEGRVQVGETCVLFVDLPGTYGLNTVSLDEMLARDFLLSEQPSAVIAVIDSSNLTRNLYLAVQTIELGLKVVLAMNMTDEVDARGDVIDYDQLGRILRCPIVKTVGHRGKGIEELKQACIQFVQEPKSDLVFHYGEPLDSALLRLTDLLLDLCQIPHNLTARWIALKLLEGEDDLLENLGVEGDRARIIQEAGELRKSLEQQTGLTADLVVVDRRYGIIRGVIRECVTLGPRDRMTLTEKIDNVVLHRVLALPIFLAMMWLTYQFTFTVGKPFMVILELFFRWLTAVVSPWLVEAPPWVHGFLVNGILGGIGSLIVFIPNIMLLFLGIAFLEDSGYMARAAFVIDRFMHHIGLHGKAFIPLIIGFGCNVPAIMATRTLESRRDRILTIIINPFISCGARMPIWILLAGAFFSDQWAGTVVFGVVLFGLMIAVLSALALNRFVLPGQSAPFVMELPPYRFPTFHSLLVRMWERNWLFLKKVGSVVLLGVVLIWFLGYFPWGVQPNGPASYAGRLGKVIEPVLKPIGIDWRGAVALTFGIVAKEVVISSLGVLYDVSDDASSPELDQTAVRFETKLQEQLRANMTRLQALSFMIFALLYMPCLATIGAIFKEIGSIKWALFALGYGLSLAYLISLVVYQSGMLLCRL